MGKSGDALRAAKKQKVIYTFTAEQLAQHDRLMLKTHMDNMRAKIRPEVEEAVAAEWDLRTREFTSGSMQDNFMAVLQYLISASSRVLIEKFHWKPLTGEYDRRNKTMRFAEELVKEIDRVCGDDGIDVRQYSEETYKLYGVRYMVEEGCDNESDKR